MKNIEKVINCGGPSFSSGMYGCPYCGTMVFIPAPALLDFLSHLLHTTFMKLKNPSEPDYIQSGSDRFSIKLKKNSSTAAVILSMPFLYIIFPSVFHSDTDIHLIAVTFLHHLQDKIFPGFFFKRIEKRYNSMAASGF